VKFSKHTLAFCIAAVLLAVVPSAAQSGQQTGAPPGMPPMPKPGPEHDLFKEDVGTWDAIVEVYMQPGAPPMKSKGVETNTLGCGGLCLITDFKGEMMPGASFHGHGTATWDPAKKKYVGSWTDSMSTGIGISEATWDPATRTVTGYMEGPDMSGNVTKMKSVSEYKSPDTRVFTMYSPGPEGTAAAAGKETVAMRITYTRRK
jgi:hypothetical protein